MVPEMSLRKFLAIRNGDTHRVIVLLLTEDETEFRVVMVCFIELGSEEDHDPVLQEVVVLSRVRVEPLVLQIVYPMHAINFRHNIEIEATDSLSLMSTWKQMISPS